MHYPDSDRIRAAHFNHLPRRPHQPVMQFLHQLRIRSPAGRSRPRPTRTWTPTSASGRCWPLRVLSGVESARGAQTLDQSTTRWNARSASNDARGYLINFGQQNQGVFAFLGSRPLPAPTEPRWILHRRMEGETFVIETAGRWF